MPCGPECHQPLPPGLGVDDGDVDVVGLASIGADRNGPSVRRRRIARKVMLDAVACAHRKVFEPAVPTAHVHLPPLGAPRWAVTKRSPVGDHESPCAAAPSMANAVRGSPPATGISQTTAGPSLGETNASVDPSGENANGAGPE